MIAWRNVSNIDTAPVRSFRKAELSLLCVDTIERRYVTVSRYCAMARFILRRCIETLLVLLVMSFVIYSLIGLMPGDPLDVMLASSPGMTPEVAAHLRAIYGLDQPLLLRYWHWLVAALGGDFGFSRSHAQPALQVLAPALVETCQADAVGFHAQRGPGTRPRHRCRASAGRRAWTA